MTTLGEFAENYEPKAKTKNISDLPEISTELELEDDEFQIKNDKGEVVKTVKQKVLVVNGEKYRVPGPVIKDIRVMREDNPKITKFKVRRTGKDKSDTKYTVIPIL